MGAFTMSENQLSNPAPQFKTAEYTVTSGGDRCKTCNQAIVGQYYRVNGVTACQSCAEQVKSQMPKDTHQAYMRAIIFGVGAAILGLILYAAFGIITGLEIGYISLAVGYIVGKGITYGSKGMGGRRYQLAAALLTYAAVSIAAIPIGISQSNKADRTPDVNQSQSSLSVSDQSPKASSADASRQDAQGAGSRPGLGAALGYLALLGLASPFLQLQDPIQGVIGLVILFVGIRIAWKLTAGSSVDIIGPFNTAPALTQTDGG
jgi:hypothetical protein